MPPRSKADEVRLRIIREMTPAQRWAQACRLHESAKMLKRAGLRAQHPDWDEERIEQKLREMFLYATT